LAWRPPFFVLTLFFKGNAVADGTWASVSLMTWTIVEPDVYLIAACLPTYRPLLVDFLSKTNLLRKSALSASGKSSGLQHPSLGSREIDSNKKHSAGFKKLGESNESIDAGEVDTADHIRLVNMTKNDLERALGPNEIHVRNDYYVRQGVQ